MYHWFILLALLCLIQQLSGCPSVCSCSLGHVDCSRRGLISVPRHLPSTATSIDISGNDIERLISSSFFNATSIVSIDASDNRIRLIDPTLFSVLNLSVINLRKNRLTSVPCGFSALERLDLSANSVAILKEEDVRCLAAVRIVDLSRNRIGEIAVTRVKHSILQRLDLASNTIRSLPAGVFSSFPFIFSLRLSRNKISFVHRHAFKGLSRLEALELGRNQLSSVPALVFEELVSLRHLHLFRNRLEGLEDGVFFGCHSLHSLNLTLNRIQNLTEGWLFGLNSLQTLDLSSNEISIFDPTVWGQTPNLRWLSLQNNHLSSLFSGAFRLLPMLQFLSLADNRIQSIHKTAMTGLDRLDSLDLSGNNLAMCVEDGAVLSNTSLPYLQSLFFARNDLKVVPSKAFSRFPNLKNLDLSENHVATLHEGAFEPLKLQKLSLQTSSLLCDCLVSWFPNWLYKTGLPRDSITAICSHPAPLKNIPVVNIDHENLTCVDDSPRARIVLHPSSTVVVEKSTTQFSCRGYGMEPIVIQWMKVESGRARPLKENRFTSINTTRSNIFNNTMTGHEMVESVLQLDAITLSDSGDYQCVVSNLFATVYSVRADLQVHQPPTFLIEPDDLSLLVGLNTKISCAATGIPSPTLRWSKDGGQAFPAATERRLHVRQGDDHLYILNVTTADQGVYTCHASNSVGSSQASATLRVHEHGFRSKIADSKVSEGDTHIYECLADVAQQRIVWLKNGHLLETDGTRVLLKAFDQVMVISKVVQSDAGQYDCELWAGGDVLTRQTAKLSVSTLLEVPSGAALIVRAEKSSRVSIAVVISCGVVLFVIMGLVFSLIYWCRQPPLPVAV